MAYSRELPSNLPRDIVESLRSEPIALGETSIGAHFRNAAEIMDVKTAIDKIARTTGHFSIGLAGRRLHGQFAFTPRELYKLIYHFQPDAIDLDLEDGHMIWAEIDRDTEEALSLTGKLPPRLFGSLNTLAEFLDQKQKELVNLADINFKGLPWDVLRPTLWRRIDTPLIFQADRAGFTAAHSSEYLYQRVHPHPAAFFPHINLVVFSESENSYQEERDIGRESGVEIVTFVLSPFNNYTNSREYPTELYSEGIEGYTPFMQEAE